MIGVVMSVGRYAKFIVAAAIAALTVLASAITDGHITNGEWVQIALAGLGAVGVFVVPNKSA
jgi:flavoprotein